MADVERDGPFEAYSTLRTNAQYNREQAMRLFEVGYTPARIAREFSEVFFEEGGKLGQLYHRILSDGRGESDIMILSEVVDAMIAREENENA